MDTQRLIALSNDPRALNPNTVRQVLREEGIQNTKEENTLEFFMDCVTIRHLLADGETNRAALCAAQLGVTLADFAPVHATTNEGARPRANYEARATLENGLITSAKFADYDEMCRWLAHNTTAGISAYDIDAGEPVDQQQLQADVAHYQA